MAVTLTQSYILLLGMLLAAVRVVAQIVSVSLRTSTFVTVLRSSPITHAVLRHLFLRRHHGRRRTPAARV